MHRENPITASELLSLEGGRAELVKGQLIMMSPSGGRDGTVAFSIGRLLGTHVFTHRLGVVCAAETGFLIERNPDTVRAPDAAFVAAARVPSDGPPDAFWPFAPDLAVEVVSPSDRWTAVEEKARSWLVSGTRLVWVVDPRGRTVHVYHQTKEALRLAEGDVLDGEDVVPGFSVTVAELFL